MSCYIIAVKRDRRAEAGEDWVERLAGIPGLEVRGSGRGTRLLVDATDDAIEEVRRRVGDLCHIEAEVLHKPL